MLATAGNVIFWGDLDRKFRTFDADTGQILWEQTLGGAAPRQEVRLELL